MTTTSPFICACSVPQNSEHSMRYVPGLVALNHTVSYWPGTASCLMAEGGDEESVHDILGGQLQPHRLVDRDVQRINFALAARMFHLPHPLLADPVDLEVAGR